jgi:hypothetical protein
MLHPERAASSCDEVLVCHVLKYTSHIIVWATVCFVPVPTSPTSTPSTFNKSAASGTIFTAAAVCVQMEERVLELEDMSSPEGHQNRSSASGSLSPDRSADQGMRRGRRRSGRTSVPRRTETTPGGIIGTFDDVSPHPDAAEASGARGGGMPPIQEEAGDGRAGPDNDALDAQFQNLMNEINNNLGCAFVFLHVACCHSMPAA